MISLKKVSKTLLSKKKTNNLSYNFKSVQSIPTPKLQQRNSGSCCTPHMSEWFADVSLTDCRDSKASASRRSLTAVNWSEGL